MSSDILARVNAFADKAEELAVKGHLLRAAENFGRAAEAASALGVDSLVALNMRLRQGNMLRIYTTSPEATSDPRFLAAHRAECIALYSDAVDALGRRRVAGTLLEGKCTAAEEAWRTGEVQRFNANMSADRVAYLAAMVGYDETLRAAALFAGVLAHARQFAAECSGVQFLC